MTRVRNPGGLNRTWLLAFAMGAASSLLACSGPVPIGSSLIGVGGAGGNSPGSSTPIITGVAGGKGTAGTGTGTTTGTSAVWPPAGYVNVTNVSYGAYALGPQLTSTSGTSTPDAGSGSGGSGMGTPTVCSGLYGVVRDFKMGTTPGGQPDFQSPTPQDDRGIVTTTLGSDGKPVYANPGGTTPTTTGQADFNQWYNDVPGVNMTYLLGLHFVPNGNVVTFAASINNKGVPDSSYFPLDGQGFGNQGENHNFSFTTEIHTSFTYNGGETFTFQGDDDVWVYINNQLVIDLGGIHVQETETVNLDAQASQLGITVGNIYPLAVFDAERHTVQSNFRIDTTLAFADCGQIVN
jgi:fibro-slime domain-containing protein